MGAEEYIRLAEQLIIEMHEKSERCKDEISHIHLDDALRGEYVLSGFKPHYQESTQ